MKHRTIHEPYDSQRWREIFPLGQMASEPETFFRQLKQQHPGIFGDDTRVQDYLKPYANKVASPFEMTMIEQLRELEFDDVQPREPVETDVFLWKPGEPKHRACTKVGGLPYWPKNRRWPTAKSGRPLNFIAQFCFADSRDITRDLPGDVLVIFSNGEFSFSWEDEDKSNLQFVWLPLGLDDLVASEQLPPLRYHIAPYCGIIHRTVDYAEADDEPDRLWALDGTKIGGIPWWVQGESELHGSFLCMLTSISDVWPGFDLSQSRTQAYSYSGNASRLMWGDSGNLYLSIDTDGSVHWHCQFY